MLTFPKEVFVILHYSAKLFFLSFCMNKVYIFLLFDLSGDHMRKYWCSGGESNSHVLLMNNRVWADPVNLIPAPELSLTESTNSGIIICLGDKGHHPSSRRVPRIHYPEITRNVSVNLVGAPGFEPGTCRLSYHYSFRYHLTSFSGLLMFVVWNAPWPWEEVRWPSPRYCANLLLGPCRPLSTPSNYVCSRIQLSPVGRGSGILTTGHTYLSLARRYLASLDLAGTSPTLTRSTIKFPL